MISTELFNTIKQEISYDLTGELTFDGQVIKWEYDGIKDLHISDFEDYLFDTCEIDKDIINEYFHENNLDYLVFSNPEIDDTFIHFYIEE